MIRLIDYTLTTAFKRTQIILMAKSAFWLAGVSASQLQKLKFDDCLQAEMHPIWYQVYFVLCKPLNQSGQLKNTPTQNISRMSFFRKMNKCKKATTVVRCFNASYLRYIDFLRNYCYSTSHVPIPPILLTCRPHPWNIPQTTNISSTNNLKNNTSPLSIINMLKLSKRHPSSSFFVTKKMDSHQINCSFKICRFNSSRFSRRSSIDFTNSLEAVKELVDKRLSVRVFFRGSHIKKFGFQTLMVGF